MTIDISDKELLVGCKSGHDLEDRLLVKYKDKMPVFKIYNRAKNLWYRRVQYLADVEEERKANHTVLVPKEIKTKAVPVSRGMTFAEDELLVKIHNQLVLNGKLLEEQLCLFRKLAEVKS